MNAFKKNVTAQVIANHVIQYDSMHDLPGLVDVFTRSEMWDRRYDASRPHKGAILAVARHELTTYEQWADESVASRAVIDAVRFWVNQKIVRLLLRTGVGRQINPDINWAKELADE